MLSMSLFLFICPGKDFIGVVGWFEVAFVNVLVNFRNLFQSEIHILYIKCLQVQFLCTEPFGILPVCLLLTIFSF